ncbi:MULTISPECIES: IS66 family transposase [Segatella]|uniref:Transposase n=3 Tax=Segatella TaxID=2974251 RepID=D8DXS0_9BACT|nr:MULTISPECIES: transposase [Segatella]EFI71765.1 transposase [Segatella baroniae B14]GJG28288.1 transposase [Segatella bryantii]SEQ76282.1 transposase [Segatella baroniae B14]
MYIIADEMAKQFTDTDEVLRMINLRLRKLEKSDSEKTEEIGRLNRIIGQKDKEIHRLKMDLASTRSELADAKAHIEELEENAGEHQSSDDDEDNSSGTSGKPEKSSSNSSVPPSQESIAARELRRTKSLRKPSGKPSGGQPGHKGSTLKSVTTPDRIIEHKPHYCKCCGRPLSVGFRKIRTTQVIDIKFIVETNEHQYYEKVCQCGCVNNCDAPNCRIKYGDNIRALVTYLNVVQCIPLKRIECASVVGADETGAAVGKELHWNWIFQNDLLTYVYQMKSRGQQAIDSKFPNGQPNSTLVTDRHRNYFNMNVKDHQVCLAHLLRNAEDLNELDTKQDWSRRFIHLIAHAIDLRRAGDITKRKIKILKTKMKNLLGESLTHLDEEFESFKKGILKVKNYLFTFLTDLHVPYENNASERGVRKIKVKQKVSGCFRTDVGANDFAKIHSIAETAMKNGNSKFNAILAVVQQ